VTRETCERRLSRRPPLRVMRGFGFRFEEREKQAKRRRVRRLGKRASARRRRVRARNRRRCSGRRRVHGLARRSKVRTRRIHTRTRRPHELPRRVSPRTRRLHELTRRSSRRTRRLYGLPRRLRKRTPRPGLRIRPSHLLKRNNGVLPPLFLWGGVDFCEPAGQGAWPTFAEGSTSTCRPRPSYVPPSPNAAGAPGSPRTATT
jgi:hypothetical protein